MKHICRDGSVYWVEGDGAFFHREDAPAEITTRGSAMWLNQGDAQRLDEKGMVVMRPREDVPFHKSSPHLNGVRRRRGYAGRPVWSGR